MKKGKGYHIYIKDPALVGIFDLINEERGALSAVVMELAWNGMNKVIDKRLKERTDALRKLKRANKAMKGAKKLKMTREEVLYAAYCKRVKEALVELSRADNLSWVVSQTEDWGTDPKTVLDELEKRYEEELKR